MAQLSTSTCLRKALHITTNSSVSIPLFLAPSFSAQHSQSRQFSSTPSRSSKLARKPVGVPSDVSLTLIHPKPPVSAPANPFLPPADPTLRVEGPKGTLKMRIPHYISLQRKKATGPIALSVRDSKLRSQRSMWGTTRALLSNAITGVSEGHTAILRLVGVGYRATIESTAMTKTAEFEGQKFVSLKVGYSHPIELPVPLGVVASTPAPTRILLEGVDRESVMQFAAHIRDWRVPEPYKGKGIFVNDETIQLKAKKIK